MDVINMPALEHHRILPDKEGCAVVRFKTDHHGRKLHELM
jgi:ribosomal protein S4E